MIYAIGKVERMFTRQSGEISTMSSPIIRAASDVRILHLVCRNTTLDSKRARAASSGPRKTNIIVQRHSKIRSNFGAFFNVNKCVGQISK